MQQGGRNTLSMKNRWQAGVHVGVRITVGKTSLAKDEEHDVAQPVVLGLHTDCQQHLPDLRPISCHSFSQAQASEQPYLCISTSQREERKPSAPRRPQVHHVPAVTMLRRTRNIMDMSTHYVLLKFCTAAASGLVFQTADNLTPKGVSQLFIISKIYSLVHKQTSSI